MHAVLRMRLSDIGMKLGFYWRWALHTKLSNQELGTFRIKGMERRIECLERIVREQHEEMQRLMGAVIAATATKPKKPQSKGMPSMPDLMTPMFEGDASHNQNQNMNHSYSEKNQNSHAMLNKNQNNLKQNVYAVRQNDNNSHNDYHNNNHNNHYSSNQSSYQNSNHINNEHPNHNRDGHGRYMDHTGHTAIASDYGRHTANDGRPKSRNLMQSAVNHGAYDAYFEECIRGDDFSTQQNASRLNVPHQNFPAHSQQNVPQQSAPQRLPANSRQNVPTNVHANVPSPSSSSSSGKNRISVDGASAAVTGYNSNINNTSSRSYRSNNSSISDDNDFHNSNNSIHNSGNIVNTNNSNHSSNKNGNRDNTNNRNIRNNSNDKSGTSNYSNINNDNANNSNYNINNNNNNNSKNNNNNSNNNNNNNKRKNAAEVTKPSRAQAAKQASKTPARDKLAQSHRNFRGGAKRTRAINAVTTRSIFIFFSPLLFSFSFLLLFFCSLLFFSSFCYHVIQREIRFSIECDGLVDWLYTPSEARASWEIWGVRLFSPIDSGFWSTPATNSTLQCVLMPRTILHYSIFFMAGEELHRVHLDEETNGNPRRCVYSPPTDPQSGHSTPHSKCSTHSDQSHPSALHHLQSHSRS